MSSGVRDFRSGMGIGMGSRVRAMVNTHDGPRHSTRAYPTPMPRRVASSPRRSRNEPLLLAGKRASSVPSNTAVDHASASHHSRSSPRTRRSRMTRIYERGCARMPLIRRPWACETHRGYLKSRACRG
jgi:hypothetical protein